MRDSFLHGSIWNEVIGSDMKVCYISNAYLSGHFLHAHITPILASTDRDWHRVSARATNTRCCRLHKSTRSFHLDLRHPHMVSKGGRVRGLQQANTKKRASLPRERPFSGLLGLQPSTTGTVPEGSSAGKITQCWSQRMRRREFQPSHCCAGFHLTWWQCCMEEPCRHQTYFAVEYPFCSNLLSSSGIFSNSQCSWHSIAPKVTE